MNLKKSLSDGCLAFEDSGKVYLKIKFNNQFFDKVDVLIQCEIINLTKLR